MIIWYQRDGTPYPPDSQEIIEVDMQNDKLRRVALDKLPNGVTVSTVWLAINHRFGEGRPLIFETMLFVNHNRKVHAIGDQWRYSTEEEAKLGHKMLAKKWRAYKNATQVLSELKLEER